MRIGEKSLSWLKIMGLFTHSNFTCSCMDKMYFIYVTNPRPKKMPGKTLLPPPVMEMQVGIASEGTLRIIVKYRHG
ncbi:hypothetical protein D3C75_818940 [compost metagenome]